MIFHDVLNMFSKKIKPLAYNRQFKLGLNFLITSVFRGHCAWLLLGDHQYFLAETPPENEDRFHMQALFVSYFQKSLVYRDKNYKIRD